MNKIGIISGGGALPLLIGKNLINKKYKVCFLYIKNFADPKVYENYENIQIELTSFTKILDALKKYNVEKIILVGKISRPTIKDIKFDFNTISLIKDYFLESKGDDELLKYIKNFFHNEGFPLFDWKSTCSELFANDDHLTIKKPSSQAIKNKNKGLDIFKIIGRADIGQSLIIQNQIMEIPLYEKNLIYTLITHHHLLILKNNL